MIDQDTRGVLRMYMCSCLSRPIAHDAEWSDYERWLLSTMAICHDQRNDLYCLAQTHVICQDAAARKDRRLLGRKTCRDIQVGAITILPKLDYIL